MEGVVIVHKYPAAIGAAVLLAVFAFVFPCFAEDAKITLVEVQGNRRIESATILSKVKTKEGNVFSPSLIKDDIKTLYQLGHFEDVQVKTEGFEDGLKVIFFVKEKPLIREISFEGNEELATEKLKEGLTLLPRTAYNIQLINETAEKTRFKYQDAGFYDAVVVPVVTELRGGDRNVVFYIEEGKKVTLEEVIVTGCKAISAKEIKSAIKNQEDSLFSFMGRNGTLRTEELKDDVEAIRNLYYNKGYIQVQVDDPVVEPKSYTFRECYFWGPKKTFLRKSELVVRFNIKEGDQFKVGSIALKGNTLLSDDELFKEIHLKNGDIFSRDMLRQDVGRIMDRYDSIARPFADVVPQFNIDDIKKTVAINIDIQEGGEVRIGRIDITGNSKTRDKVIRREMRLDEGDLYSKKSIKRSYERLTNLNFFETVDIAQERRRQESIMDLGVKVKEKLTGTLSVGGGYSSVDKLVGIAEVTQGNLGGRGQLLKFKTQWGGTRKLFMLTFMEPYLFDKPVWGRFDLYNSTQDFDGYSLRTNGFAFAIGKSFGEYVSTSLRYSLDSSLMTNLSVTNISFAVQRQLDTYGRGVNTSALTWSLARDSRDFYLDPRNGSKNSIFVEYAGGPLGGDPNFVKSVGESAWYFPLFWDTVFMTRGRAGYVESLIEKPIPMGERFFVGGGSTVRGFRYGTAGPVDREGNRVGGNKELIFNFEFTFPIVPAARLKGVVFYDWGRAFDDNLVANDSPTGKPKEPTQISLKELRSSWGWGFWWLSPIGPLKFEWGYIIRKRPSDEKSEFEFSIGALF